MERQRLDQRPCQQGDRSASPFDGKGGATAVQRWNVGKRVRDIEEAPDGSLWMFEDANPGGLYRLTPK